MALDPFGDGELVARGAGRFRLVLRVRFLSRQHRGESMLDIGRSLLLGLVAV